MVSYKYTNLVNYDPLRKVLLFTNVKEETSLNVIQNMSRHRFFQEDKGIEEM